MYIRDLGFVSFFVNIIVGTMTIMHGAWELNVVRRKHSILTPDYGFLSARFCFISNLFFPFFLRLFTFFKERKRDQKNQKVYMVKNSF